MAYKKSIPHDVIIVGSGFSGSLTALCLHQSGINVCVIEKEEHPRFAIGESSTPIADMILRSLSEKYRLPWLKDFSRYGSWQKHYPEITCGLKRGFSYYKHTPKQQFTSNEDHQNELLVAASNSNDQSDTNWLRSDFDAHLVKRLEEYGVPYFDRTKITSAKKNKNWKIKAKKDGNQLFFESDFLIDATGSPQFLNKFLNIDSTRKGFKTHSKAIFSHFKGIKPWKIFLEEKNISTGDYPYDPDFSALHHLLKEGWMWMLRFNNGLTSAGILANLNQADIAPPVSAEKYWSQIIKRYPSLAGILRDAKIADNPGQFIETGRLQRRLLKIAGLDWAALPHTAGFIDPMHSTGIAHTLSGVEKLVNILTEPEPLNRTREERLKSYEQSVITELNLIDLLVAGSYKSMHQFRLFSTYTMLYFISAISYEQQRLKGKIPSHFLCADNQEIRNIIDSAYADLSNLFTGSITPGRILEFKEKVRSAIDPFNTAGLLNPESNNMYRHTAVEI